MNRVVAVALCIVAVAPASQAQSAFPAEPSIVAPIAIGSLLGLGGMAVGAYVGFKVDETCDDTGDFCLEPGGFLGAALAGTAGASLGAHLGNRQRGSVGKVFLYSLLTWAAGIGSAVAFAAVDDDAGVAVLVALPAVQLGVTVAMERRSGRQNEARHRDPERVPVLFAPGRDGIRVGAALAF